MQLKQVFFILMLVCISMSYPPDTNTQKSSLVTHLLDAKPVSSLEDLNTGTRKKRKLKKFKPRLKSKEGAGNQKFTKDTVEKIETEGRPIHEKAKVFPTKPSLVLRDYFGTPFPLKSSDTSTSERDFVKPILPLPLVVSNDIGTKNFDKNSIFETLKSLTGATPVGVTNEVTYHEKDDKTKKSEPLKKNIISRDNTKELDSEVSSAHDSDAVQNQRGHHSRQDYARQLSGPAPNSRTSRRKSQQKVVNKDVYKVDESDRKELLNSDAIIQPSKTRKGKKKSKRNKFRKATINTVERYRFENEDGSITWGYMNEDGGFKEETIGMDCITHGKYGYIDPTGQQREYSYTSGLRCDPNTRKATLLTAGSTGSKGANGKGFFDYSSNRFIMPNGRRVTVVVNQNNKARGRRYKR